MERIVIVFAIVIRLALLFYGDYQDATMRVKYTDIDYTVFSDAARYVWEGQSPYDRATYRYTPLLAWIVTPNIFLHPSFGKILFVISDIIVGVLIQCVIQRWIAQFDPKKKMSQATQSVVYLMWFLNPIVINTSTRGNAESLICLLVILTVYLATVRRVFFAAVVFGLAVHFKIYPVLFALPLQLWIDRNYLQDSKRQSWMPNSVFDVLARAQFGLISFATFASITFAMYVLYGPNFLSQTYLYHLYRKDIAHNFSVYFYHLCLQADNAVPSIFSSPLFSFFPQLVLSVGFLPFVWRAQQFLGIALFLTTFAFVTFNKVVTVQYFVWYFGLAGLCVPWLSLSLVSYALLALAWVASQGGWLYFAYQLEFLGQNTYSQVWMAGLAFFAVNIFIMVAVISSVEPVAPKKETKAD